MIRRLGGVAVVYAMSVGALFIAEILLVGRVSAQDYGGFRLILNAAPLLALIAMMGNESATARLVAERRSPTRWTRVQTRRLIAALALGAVTGLYGAAALDLSWGWGACVAGLAVCLTVTNFFSAIQRSMDAPRAAAWSQQGYRLVGGSLIIGAALVGVSTVPPAMFLLLAAAIFAAACIVWSARQDDSWVPDAKTAAWSARVGPGFALSGITMAALDLVDQAVVAHRGGLKEAGAYAATKLFHTFPIISIASILAFVSLPVAVRFVQHPGLTSLRHAHVFGLAASGGLAAILGGLGFVCYGMYTGEQADWIVALAMMLAGWFRLYYLVPMSLLSALTSGAEIRRMGILGIVSLALFLVIALAVPASGVVERARIVAIALAGCFAVRSLGATALANAALRKRAEPLE